ncbi:tRNA pseudouridine(13) synthase TruD [Helicobacter sp.]|uniref:tRNA pseudouridine(13) synthase TruD n=1 Tax=Helicobacter sp. TaxID=218 RepID=UPI0019B74022|nr:tRNA pseudouridine(13) synthase TruD [Helicobacter sp.]MBD5165055.1 tRNA pseudouridine(13) synthase TruD [Helicobacter sp.]
MNLAFAYTHSPIYFHFRQSPRDFVVEEVPLYSFSGEGAHLILKIRKKSLTTFELLKILSATFGIKENEIGYAGLKDKNALSIQHISLPRYLIESKIESFNHPQIKILNQTYHNNKIKLGHLKGNRFFIRLKKLDHLNAQKILEACKRITQFGIPNYFGYQRFGKEGNNYQLGLEIIEGKCKIRNKKLQNFLISAYQSYLFNLWLSLRLDISHLIANTAPESLHQALKIYLHCEEIPHHFSNMTYCKMLKNQPHCFKLLKGDSMCHYPFGKNFILNEMDNLIAESERFMRKEIAITGILSGAKAKVSEEEAGFLESRFLDSRIRSVGQRRYAWIFPENLSFHYKEQEAQGEIEFYLPKGAYATNLLREIAHREIVETIDLEFYEENTF